MKAAVDPNDGGPAVLSSAAATRLASSGQAQAVRLVPGTRHPKGPLLALEGILGLGDAGPLRAGIATAPSPDNPLPPDRFGPIEAVCECILARPADRRPLLIVEDMAAWPPDALVDLGYLLRRLARVGERAVFAAQVGEEEVTRRLRDALLFTDAPETPVLPGLDIAEAGMAGVFLATGAHIAARRSLEARHSGPASRDAARLYLVTGDDAALLPVLDGLEATSVATSNVAFARRLRLLAMRRRAGGGDALVADMEPVTEGSPPEWLALDAALYAVLTGDDRAHVAILDGLLRDHPCGDPACLATALIWRGSAYYLAGTFDKAVTVMRRSVEVLDRLGEVRRARHVRLRLATLLSALGCLTEAISVFRAAAGPLLALGDGAGFATAHYEAEAAVIRLGDDPAKWAEETAPLWIERWLQRTANAAFLSHRLAVERALQHSDQKGADTAAAALSAQAATEYQLFETALLMALAARLHGTDELGYLNMALQYAKLLPAEERPLALLRLDKAV